MTEYRTINVDKRAFNILVNLPKLSNTQRMLVLADDTRITRNGDTRITRNGDTRIAHNTADAYPRAVSVRKRSFLVLAKVNEG